MSSTADSLKKTAEEPAADEPDAKKAKISGKDETSDKNIDNSNGTASESSKLDNNNGGGSKTSGNKVPSKVVNGNDKDSKQNNEGADIDDDDDDADEGATDGIFDPKIAKSLESVENIQLEICKLNEKASEEILKVEQKFNELRRPHFEKRNELLKDIPNFWLTSLANHPMIAPMIESAEDEDCLHYVVNLDVEEFEDIKSGYKLKLHFITNPYIANDVIVKEFHHLNSEEIMSTATPIEYKDTPQGKSLKQVVDNSIAQYKRSRRPGQTQNSFFAWLVEPSESGTDEIAEIIKDQIWPSPLEFFFATPEDYGGGTDDESDDEDEEIDDEEIDDEEGVIGEEYIDEDLENEEDDEDDDGDEDDGEE